MLGPFRPQNLTKGLAGPRVSPQRPERAHGLASPFLDIRRQRRHGHLSPTFGKESIAGRSAFSARTIPTLTLDSRASANLVAGDAKPRDRQKERKP